MGRVFPRGQSRIERAAYDTEFDPFALPAPKPPAPKPVKPADRKAAPPPVVEARKRTRRLSRREVLARARNAMRRRRAAEKAARPKRERYHSLMDAPLRDSGCSRSDSGYTPGGYGASAPINGGARCETTDPTSSDSSSCCSE